jgi:hypothetical protein
VNARRRRRLRSQKNGQARSPRLAVEVAQARVQAQKKPGFLGPGSFEP